MKYAPSYAQLHVYSAAHGDECPECLQQIVRWDAVADYEGAMMHAHCAQAAIDMES